MQLLKFYTSWCNPCKVLSKTMEDIQFPFDVIPVDIEENMDMAIRYNVLTVPTLILVDEKGSPIVTHQGSTVTKEELQEKFFV